MKGKEEFLEGIDNKKERQFEFGLCDHGRPDRYITRRTKKKLGLTKGEVLTYAGDDPIKCVTHFLDPNGRRIILSWNGKAYLVSPL